MKLTIQLLIAVVLVVSGLVLLFLGFFAPPLGAIDHSVLIAILGVDYSYRLKIKIKDDEKHGNNT